MELDQKPKVLRVGAYIDAYERDTGKHDEKLVKSVIKVEDVLGFDKPFLQTSASLLTTELHEQIRVRPVLIIEKHFRLSLRNSSGWVGISSFRQERNKKENIILQWRGGLTRP